MSIITISRGSFTHGGVVAEKVAEKLGYECISREVLLDVSKKFNVPEIKLTRAIHDAPRVLERFTFGRDRYINYIRAEILKYLVKDNMVYHGFAGHFFVKDIPHVMKIRICADMSYRVKCMMEREKISEEEAKNQVVGVDEERQKWGRKLYGIDTWDSRMYDLVININKISVDHAVKIICDIINSDFFKTTPESQKQMDALYADANEILEKSPDQAPFFEPMRLKPWQNDKK
ncbi:MAG: cytidylate kinase-like family protein [Desulfobacterales bacterium]|nr:cytidylate kinase-like family protein [Desulfobacterales bacterium]